MNKLGIATCVLTLAVSYLAGCSGGTATSPSNPLPPQPPAPTVTNEWTWISGSQPASSGIGATGTYGIQGTPAAANAPDSRGVAAGWSDSSGNLWIFGGSGPDATDSRVGQLNDLWRYNPTTKQWTWITGSNTTNSPAVYGTLGVASVSNIPGGRQVAASWQDSAGNFWIFGGSGYNASSQSGLLNDLWMYSPTSNEWTWMGGTALEFSAGVYGTLGTPDPQNIPGAREGSSFWKDTQGNFWMFGGNVQGSIGPTAGIVEGDSNDMWEFNPKTALWTWVGGSQTLVAQAVYGVQGTANAANNPGNRENASTWVDSKGNFWLFGGSGIDSTGHRITFNDLWQFVPSTGVWTWIAGSSAPNAVGIYGTQGTAASGNTPGARDESATWTDSKGNLLLFGGFGLGESSTSGDLNDLWSFNTTTSQWTWLHGSSAIAATATYGTLGTAATANDPGARGSSNAILDSSGDLWLFGGYTVTSQHPGGTVLNDLWKYTP